MNERLAVTIESPIRPYEQSLLTALAGAQTYFHQLEEQNIYPIRDTVQRTELHYFNDRVNFSQHDFTAEEREAVLVDFNARYGQAFSIAFHYDADEADLYAQKTYDMSVRAKLGRLAGRMTRRLDHLFVGK